MTMTSLSAEMTAARRNYTTTELPPTVSTDRLLDYAASGRTVDNLVSLVLSEDAAQLLAKVVLRYNSAAAAGEVRVDDDHDSSFWDSVAIDLMTAADLPAPPASCATTMAMSIGRTGDR